MLFIRYIDVQGRVVIPRDVRKQVGLGAGDAVAYFVDGAKLILQPYRPGCVLCGEASDVVQVGSKRICRACAREILGLSDWIICSFCGQRAESNKALGINGRWLCERCLTDKDKLDNFLEAGIGKVVRAAVRAARGDALELRRLLGK